MESPPRSARSALWSVIPTASCTINGTTAVGIGSRVAPRPVSARGTAASEGGAPETIARQRDRFEMAARGVGSAGPPRLTLEGWDEDQTVLRGGAGRSVVGQQHLCPERL